MKLSTLVVFGAGYVIGTKAGRERYEEIVKVAQKIGQRLDELSARAEEAGEADAGGEAEEQGFGRRTAAGAYTDELGGDVEVEYEYEEETLRGSPPEGLGGRPFARRPPVDVGRGRPRRAG